MFCTLFSVGLTFLCAEIPDGFKILVKFRSIFFVDGHDLLSLRRRERIGQGESDCHDAETRDRHLLLVSREIIRV